MLRDSPVPLTSRAIADRLPQFAFHRVQVMVHQAERKGYAIKRPVQPSRKVGNLQWEFTLAPKRQESVSA